MTSNPAMALRPAEDLGHALAGHLAFLAESQPAGACDVRTGNDLHGGFARDFATADGGRVMVVAFSAQQFADLAQTTGRAGTFAFLERVLYANFSATDDLHTHRGTIAALLAPWFARRTYDLRRLRVHGLIERIPRAHRYQVTDTGLRLTRLHARFLRPGLSELTSQPPPVPAPLRAADRAYRNAIDNLARQARLAA